MGKARTGPVVRRQPALPSALPAKQEFPRLLSGSRRTSKTLFIWLSEKKDE